MCPSYTPDMRGGSNFVQDPGLVPPSVQEAARSLMSISSIAYHSTSTRPTMRLDGTSKRVASTGTSTRDTSTRASGLKFDSPASHVNAGAGLDTVPTVPGNASYFPALGRAVSLFGPDARKLPNPVQPSICGHPGSSGLEARSPTSANQLIAEDGDAPRPINSLSLAVDVFLEAAASPQ
ncbi:hypothetical protein ACGC1H_001329 [Rhizoctonia solani]